MNLSSATDRYRAAAMEFAADLDEHNVEMRVFTDAGKMIVIVCPRDTIFAVQKHIEQMANACPEIASWSDFDLIAARLKRDQVLRAPRQPFSL